MRWLRGNASKSERIKWTNWLKEHDTHLVLVSKANRLLELPFKEPRIPSIEVELLRLKRSVYMLNSKDGTGSGEL